MYQQLSIIKSSIEGLAQAGATGNDVVVFYFHGKEIIDAQGSLFDGWGLSARQQSARGALACDFLVNYFADISGAQILLFDVDRPNAIPAGAVDKIAHWTDYYPSEARQVAVVRYAWLGRPDSQGNDRLIQALEKALPTAARLVDVTTEVHRLVKSSPHFARTLDYYAIRP